MLGKEKCKILKEIRAQIAAANEIEWVTENCTHKGDCRGTCPKCEAEVAALERALARRRALGKTVAVAGLSAGLLVSTSACSPIDSTTTAVNGDMVAESDRTTTSVTTTTSMMMPPGSISGVPLPPSYYYTDFVLQDARLFEAKTVFYADDVLMDEDDDPPRSIEIPEGARFEVIGANAEANVWLIRYEEAYYCVYGETLEADAVEVTDEGETDASDESGGSAESGDPSETGE